MSARTKYRKRALDILFESELQGLGVGGTLADRLETNDPPVHPYTVQLVEGVIANADRIDGLITEHAQGWTLDRMPAVDRNLLRIATYEITDVAEVPTAVAIAEAVELAKELSTEDSAGFINGVLSAIA
ncbi:MAG TPA: transcription antitermination factor NusB [Aeromicrobium sp.]|nr:transcription antitermination factor NusB [Aeromicrobium sp.]